VASIFARMSLWLWRRSSADPDLRLILDAAAGNPVNDDALATAYWRMYYSTYRPREEWHALPNSKRGEVYKIRLRLIGAYGCLSQEQQHHVSRKRPDPPKV
jgi:hypothetical protein